MTRKIAFVTDSPAVWGAERSLLLLLPELRKHGFEPSVVLSKQSPLIPRLDRISIPSIEYEFAAHPALSSGSLSDAKINQIIREFPKIANSAFRLKKILHRFDAVVSFSIWQSAEAAIAARMNRQSVVLDLHETFSSSHRIPLIRGLSRLHSGVLAPSRWICRYSGIDSSPRTYVVPRPLPHGYVSPSSPAAPFPPKTYVIGIFGQLVPHKRVRELLVSYLNAEVRKNVQLWIVGGEADVSVRSAYEESVRDLADSSCGAVKVIDRVENPKDLYESCHFVVNASEHEAFGRTVLECVAARSVPVVLADTAPAEIASSMDCGIVIDSVESIGALVEAISFGTYDETISKASSLESLEYLRDYTAEAVGEDYANTLTKLMDRG